VQQRSLAGQQEEWEIHVASKLETMLIMIRSSLPQAVQQNVMPSILLVVLQSQLMSPLSKDETMCLRHA
jgi:hypothetical protein